MEVQLENADVVLGVMVCAVTRSAETSFGLTHVTFVTALWHRWAILYPRPSP
jgi:hypothetical protein